MALVEVKWKYFLAPSICGLHQGYLIVIVKYVIKFLLTQFNHS